MPLKSGTSKKVFSDNLLKLLEEGYEKSQALAISYSKQRDSKKKKGK